MGGDMQKMNFEDWIWLDLDRKIEIQQHVWKINLGMKRLDYSAIDD